MHLDARRVLLCMRYGIGDTVMELPVLTALRRCLPAAHITALGAQPATQLLRDLPHLDAVVAYDRFGLRHRWDDGGAETRQALGAWVEANQFDLALDLEHAPTPVGEAIWGRGIATLEGDDTAEEAAIAAGHGAVAAIMAGVCAGWGMPAPDEAMPRLQVSVRERTRADHLLRRLTSGVRRPVALASAASHDLKRWPLERLARVADWVVGETGEPVLLFCGPQEETAATVRGHMRHPDRLAVVGALPLPQVAALLERCRALVCNDTGLMHIAAAVGTPTVAIFGPTASALYVPPQGATRALGDAPTFCVHRHKTSLNPPACFASGPCLRGGPGCITEVGVEQVLDALRDLVPDRERRKGRVASVA